MNDIRRKLVYWTQPLVALLLASSLAACGNKEEAEVAPAAPETTAQGDAAATAVPAAPAGAAGPASAAGTGGPAAEELSNAVAVGKPSAAVDLQFDISTKPAVGQPVEVRLVFVPRLPAKKLEVTVSGMQGLTVANTEAVKFEGVVPGAHYEAKVLVQAGQAGLYYLRVMAEMATEVQSEKRAFSVPIVVGTPAAVQKPTPARDAAGEAVEPMPARESTGETR